MSEGRPHYFDVDGEAVFSVLHQPDHELRPTAVLVVPPFGWEESSSYRSRRSWAASLARDGFPVLRFDLPGSGDSEGGPTDAGRFDSWLHSIACAASELRWLTGCSSVAAIGLGMGGLLACAATTAGAQLDQLVLWGVPARGHALIRELDLFARLELSRDFTAATPSDGRRVVNGFTLSAETVRGVRTIDLRKSPPARVRRALVLGRDGVPADSHLLEALSSTTAQITVEDGPGYSELMAEPQLSLPPALVMAQVESWLHHQAPRDAHSPPRRRLCSTALLSVHDVRIKERGLEIEALTGRMFGVLSEPMAARQPLCVVLLNAGGVRRTGPNRMWVEAARRWAAQGVTTFRLDLPGVGDGHCDGHQRLPVADAQLYAAGVERTVRDALDALESRGVSPRFLVAGLCAGAYWSFKVGQTDPRVEGIVMLNPAALVYDPFQWTIRRSRFLGRIVTAQTRARILRGEVPWSDFVLVARAVLRRLSTAPSRLPARVVTWRRNRRSGGDQLDVELDRLRDKGVVAHLAFSAGEPLHAELDHEGRLGRLARWPNVSLNLFDGPSPAHMMQAPTLQHQAHALLDSAVEALLVSDKPLAQTCTQADRARA